MSERRHGPMPPNVVLRKLAIVWTDFETLLFQVPIVQRALANEIRLEEYRTLIADHYNQVKEGSGWISRAASSIREPYLQQRSVFLEHAVTEHRDYEMLEKSFVSCGGDLEDLRRSTKNIGTEALSAWMYHEASKPNPFQLLGAMFIIEGLGKRFASQYASAINESLNLAEDQTLFYDYHSAHDDDHIGRMEEMLASGILEIPDLAENILRNSRITGRLYLLQLEELGRY